MNPVIKKQNFIVAYNLLDPKKSKILSDNEDDFSLDLFLKTNSNDFIGRGFEIYSCTLVEPFSKENQIFIELDVDGKITTFEVQDYLFDFPVIEGEFVQGIYSEYDEESFDFFEITSVLSLTKFINHLDETNFRENKYLCSSDEVTFTNLEGTKPYYFFRRFPLSYFDVHCPFCDRKVVTYQTNKAEDSIDPAGNLRCAIVDLPCPHFVGLVVREGTSYDRNALDDLNRNYTYENDKLFFETEDGRWQAPHIHLMIGDKKISYWNSENEQEIFINHFLFLRDE